MKISKILFFTLFLFFILGAVSANDLNSNDDVAEIHVATTGDDLNTGSGDSPYATISKAISVVNDTEDTTIYLSKGTFSSENDVNFDINLNHKVHGGNLKFIGSGINETFIDGQSSFRFAKISENSNVTFKDLTFINFKADNGATLYSEGILTVDNCVFKDSYATGTNGGAIYSKGEYTSQLYIKNSQFISCSVNGNPNSNQELDGGGAICTNNIYYACLENNTFINARVNGNLKGCAVNIHSTSESNNPRNKIYTKSVINGNKFINITGNDLSLDAGLYVYYVGSAEIDLGLNKTFIINNEFINCYNPSDTYSIVFLRGSEDTIENNAFVNSTNDMGNICLYIDTLIYGLNFNPVEELKDITIHDLNNGLELSLNITDDMGNIVTVFDGANINLISNNQNYSYLIKYSGVKEFLPAINFNTIPNPDNYSLVLDYCGSEYFLRNVSVIYDNAPAELWVSSNGFDGNTGTKESPFETIEHAINVGFEKSFNVIINLLEGTYKGEGNVELTFANRGTLQIIGEDKNNVVIDGENIHWFLMSKSTNVTIKNVKFLNGYSDTRDLITIREKNNYGGYNTMGDSLFFENCIIDKCKVEDNYILYGVSFNNLTYTNNIGEITASIVVNSYFENNTSKTSIVSYYQSSECTFINSTFINNSATGHIISASHGFTSFNSYYANNHVDDYGLIAGGWKCVSSYNDTFINNSGNKFGIFGFETEKSRYGGNPDPRLLTYDINGSYFINNSAKKAGVLIIQKGKIINSYFINNSADYGGAILVVPNNKAGVSSNPIDFENLTFINNSAVYGGGDIYLTTDVDPTWYGDQNLYFALPLNITFNNLNTSLVSDYLTADVYGPCGAIIGGSILNFKIDGADVGFDKIVNSRATLKYSGFENGQFILSGDADNIYSSTVKDAIISVNLTNHVSSKEIWVSNDGSDVSGDGSKNNPFKTIKYAIDKSTLDCKNVMINIASGVYTGDLNTALEVSSNLNLTLKGENTTVIDGENSTWFITVLKGNNNITISDLTIRNMGIDNRESRNISSVSPININEGANLCLDNVFITNNHGGEAVIKNEGNLFITNSLIEKNGFSTVALVSGGNIYINNTSMIDNFGIKGFLACENCIINNSLIRNAFNYDGVFSLILGDCVLENTMILNDGDNSSMSALGLDEVRLLLLPALSLEGNAFLKNVSLINNYKNPPNIQTTRSSYSFLSVMGYPGIHNGKNFTAIGCSFYNFDYLWVLSNDRNPLNFTFDRCVFKNIKSLAAAFRITAGSTWIFTNSVFLDVDSNFQRPNYYIYQYDHWPISHDGVNNIPYDGNFWALNEKPVISYVDGKRIIFNYSPHNWIVLNKVNGILKLQITDGENTTDYHGDLPLSVDYVLSDGVVVPAITVDGKSYPVIFDGDSISVGSEAIVNPVIKPVVDNTIFSDDLTVYYGENSQFTARFLYPWGDPLANVNVTFTINENNFTVLSDENGVAKLNASFDCGVYDIIITNPVSGQININTLLINKVDSRISVSNVSTVYNGGKYLVIDLNGCDGNVSVVLNGKTISKVSENGIVKIPITLSPKTYIAQIAFDGDVNHRPSAATAKIVVTKATPKLTAKVATFKVKVKTKKYSITLKDNKNRALKKVKLSLKIKNKTYKATTDTKGKATFKITKLTKKGKYTAKVAFAGNTYYNKLSKSVKITVK